MKGDDISRRLVELGARVILLARALPKDVAGRHVASQLLRSSTSGGANYQEARAGESRADFIHKIGIAAKELREASYWLQLIVTGRLSDADITPLMRETDELIAILIASRRTAQRNG